MILIIYGIEQSNRVEEETPHNQKSIIKHLNKILD
jgi:hypothetical protein